jgi:autotransporter-associated beta strand protein
LVTGVTITNAGYNFTAAPTLAFSGGTVLVAGTAPTAAGNATNFQVDTVSITNPGTGYTSAPTLTVGTAAVAAQLSAVVLGSDSSVGGAGNLEIAGAISGTGFALTKVGAGTTTLSNTNTYTGATNVNEGTLLVNGGLNAASNVSVASLATLGGTGTIGGAVTVAGGGRLSPGTSPGILSTGSVDLSATTSVLKLELGGTTAGNLATNHDRLSVTGSVTLGGIAEVSLFGTFGSIAQVNDTFLVILNDGIDAVNGAFANAPGGVLNGIDGSRYQVNYAANDGNDVQLTLLQVPEPTSVVSVLGGLASLAGLSRFRRRKS